MKRVNLLICVAAGLALGYCTTNPAHAQEFAPAERAAYIGMQAATLVDWAQTRDIARRPDQFKEANPLIGDHPSVGRVNTFMASRLVVQHLAAVALPPGYRLPVMGTLTGVYTAIVMRNHRMQVDQDYGNDKAQHAIAGAAIGSIVTALTKSPAKGCAAGAAAGVLKEAYDRSHGKPASLPDALVTAAGGCAAAYLTGWTFGPGRVTYSREF